MCSMARAFACRRNPAWNPSPQGQCDTMGGGYGVRDFRLR